MKKRQIQNLNFTSLKFILVQLVVLSITSLSLGNTKTECTLLTSTNGFSVDVPIFKNLEVLKQENEEYIVALKSGQVLENFDLGKKPELPVAEFADALFVNVSRQADGSLSMGLGQIEVSGENLLFKLRLITIAKTDYLTLADIEWLKYLRCSTKAL